MKNSSNSFTLFFKGVFLIFICVFVFASCSGVSVGIGTGIGTGLPTGNNATETTETQDAGETNAVPTASLPLPSLVNDNLMAFSPDSNDNVPVAGFSGAVEFSDEAPYAAGMKVAVTTSSLTATVSCNEVAPAAFRKAWNQLSDLIIPNAVAAETTTNVCESGDATCCDLSSDGSFECFMPLISESVTSINMAIVDADGNVGEVLSESVQAKAKYVKKAPSDVTIVGDDVYTVTDGKIVKIGYDSTSSSFKVAGDKDADYGEADTSGSKIVYNSAQGVIGVLDATNGINIHDKTSSGVQAKTATATESVAESYTSIKYVNGRGYFGVKTKTNVAADIFVYDICDADNSGCDNDPNSLNRFKFIETSEGIQYDQLITFDINSSNNEEKGVFVFKDNVGNTRVRFSKGTQMFGGYTALSGVSAIDIKDIQMISNTVALMLDGANNKVWRIEIDEDDETITSALSDENAISVGSKPVSIQFNSNKSRAYVLNESGESVSVINLKNSDGSFRQSPKVVSTKNLTDLVGGKTMIFKPKAMVLDDDQLVIAANATKSLLFLDTDDITESSATDEDNDEDGYTIAQGDCNDNNASMRPGLSEVCGDSLDNDCSGSADNGCAATDVDNDSYTVADGDCNDNDANINPSASEVGKCFDNKDNDCDDFTDGFDSDCE